MQSFSTQDLEACETFSTVKPASLNHDQITIMIPTIPEGTVDTWALSSWNMSAREFYECLI